MRDDDEVKSKSQNDLTSALVDVDLSSASIFAIIAILYSEMHFSKHFACALKSSLSKFQAVDIEFFWGFEEFHACT